MKNSSSRDGKLSEILAELKAEYRTSFPRKLQKLRDAAATGDNDLLREEFHKLKGTGKTYGFPEVSVICEAMEFACQGGRADADLVRDALAILERMENDWANDAHFDWNKDAIAQRIIALGKGFKK